MNNKNNTAFIEDLTGQRSEICKYFEILKNSCNTNVTLEDAALEWIYRFAYSWRNAHKISFI